MTLWVLALFTSLLVAWINSQENRYEEAVAIELLGLLASTTGGWCVKIQEWRTNREYVVILSKEKYEQTIIGSRFKVKYDRGSIIGILGPF